MHRIVVVGGGFAGVRTVRRLAEVPGTQITLVDRTNHFVFQPMLYQVATGVLSGGQISPALRSIFRRFPNVRVLLSEVDGFDLERRVVKAFGEHEYELPYDTLVVAAGATHSYFGRDDWAVLAPWMKTVDDAHRLRSMILLTLPGHPEVIVLGDMAFVRGVPSVAQGAIQGGEHAAKVIAARQTGAPSLGAFRYKDKGSMADDRAPARGRGPRAPPRHRRSRLLCLGRHPSRLPGALGGPGRGGVAVGVHADRRLPPRAADLDRLAGAGDDGAVRDPRAQTAASPAAGPGRAVTSRACRRAPQVAQMRCSSTRPPQSLWTRTMGGPSGA